MACVWLVSLLFVGALGVPIPVSDSFLVSPEQIHLALGATPAEMVVSWVTWEDGTEPGQSVVRFGVDPTNLTLSATGSWTRYKSYCSGPSTPQYEYTSGFIHNVRLTNLTSSTQYHYQIQSSNSSAASSILNFFTQPDVGTFFKKPVNLIVAGDLGQTSDSQSTIAHMLQDTQDSVVLIAGDMSYADCDHKRWDTWGKMIEPLASTRAIMVAAGNHEIEKDLVQNVSFLGYKKRFVMPAAQPEQDSTYIDRVSDCTPSVFFGDYNYGNSFYSFELAGVHVIVLNSYTRSNPSSPQYTWLESDLVAVNRDDTPWIVVMMHCPWYNSNVDHQLEPMTVAMRTSMESLFMDYRVNIVFSGHVHSYERTNPVSNDTVHVPGGAPVYINLGDGGNREGHSRTFLANSPPCSAFRNGMDFGHTRLVVYNETHALHEWHSDNKPEGNVSDSTWLINDPKAWGKEHY